MGFGGGRDGAPSASTNQGLDFGIPGLVFFVLPQSEVKESPMTRTLPRRLLGLFLASLFAVAPIGGLSSAEHSAARVWNEQLLNAIRKDLARPTVHARNLWHTSVAMWDSWAAYDSSAQQLLHKERATADNVADARAEAISFACYRVIASRFANSPGAATTLQAISDTMTSLGYDVGVTTTEGDSAAALGNRVAQTILVFGLADNSNEANGYKNRFYRPINAPLVPKLPGNPEMVNPNRWQPLALSFFVDQAGNIILGGYPEFLSPEWGQVRAFSLTPSDRTIYTRDGFDYWVYHDPGAPPLLGTPTADYFKWGFEMVSVWSGHLDASDGVMWDISPASIGNAPLPGVGDYEAFYDFKKGGDWGKGHAMNPVTGQPYTPQIVPRGDYARALAEFWADGPSSETPPGHWFTIANYVTDHPLFERRFAGRGPVVDPLEWDVKLYFMLGGAMHDVAVTAWGMKGWYDYVRPVSAIRYMADLGQSSDPAGPRYDPNGITLHPGLIELVTAQTTAPGARHQHLAGNEGKISLFAWRGPTYISDPSVDTAGCGWILAENWWPYQRPSFVTPPFAGYISGHSTYSRAGATILIRLTGSQFFPGGLSDFRCPKNSFLVFEEGPTTDVVLQWATYQDASDQTSLSRIWGGIHPPCDDIPGRHIGQKIGENAFALALTYYGSGTPQMFHRGDVNDDGGVDIADAGAVFLFLFLGGTEPPCREAADANNDADVDISDGIFLLGYMFLGDHPPPAPGPVGQPCGFDPDEPGSPGDLGCKEYVGCVRR